MTRIRIAVHLTLVLAVAFSAVAFFIPTEAKANCFYPRHVHYEYWGWFIDSGNGPQPSCDPPLISPCCPTKELVGEKIVECDGTTSLQWGITCADVTITRTICDPICD